VEVGYKANLLPKVLLYLIITYIMNSWKEENNSLYKRFQFKDFAEAFAFMVRVALIAERHNHHPKWTNVWNTVEIWLSTHDAGQIVTDKDHALAKEIDGI